MLEQNVCPSCNQNTFSMIEYRCYNDFCGYKIPATEIYEMRIKNKQFDLLKEQVAILDKISSGLFSKKEQWHPIETAPKDGTKILLGYFTGSEFDAHPTVGWWDIDYWVNDHDVLCDKGFVDPTHWTPLLDPPKE